MKFTIYVESEEGPIPMILKEDEAGNLHLITNIVKTWMDQQISNVVEQQSEKIDCMVRSAINKHFESPKPELKGENTGEPWPEFEKRTLKKEIIESMNTIAKNHGRSLKSIGYQYKLLRKNGFNWY